MKLFRFPYLVQRLVIKQMSYGDVFLFSLCSKNSAKLIHSVGWGEIKEIEYNTVIRDMTISIRDQNDNVEKVLKTNSDTVNSETLIIKVSDKHLNYSLATTYSPLTFFFNIHHEESSFEAIHDRIDALFGKCAQYVCVNEIRVDWTIYMPSKLYFFPKNINFIRTYIDLQCAEVDLSDLERYFEAVPVQEYVHLGVFMPYSSFSPKSKFFETKSLTISQDKDLAKEVITNFKGRELSLLNMQLDNNDILNFLEQWQSKRILQNLEDLEIGTLKHIYVVEMENILKSKSFPESIDTKKLGLNEK